jgi:hypothetical protein
VKSDLAAIKEFCISSSVYYYRICALDKRVDPLGMVLKEQSPAVKATIKDSVGLGNLQAALRPDNAADVGIRAEKSEFELEITGN